MSPLLRPAFPNNRRIKPRAVCRRPSPSTCWIERIVDALTGVIVCGAGAGLADRPCHGLRYRLTGHSLPQTVLSWPKTGEPERDTISRADIDLGRSRQRHVNRIRSQ